MPVNISPYGTIFRSTLAPLCWDSNERASCLNAAASASLPHVVKRSVPALLLPLLLPEPDFVRPAQLLSTEAAASDPAPERNSRRLTGMEVSCGGSVTRGRCRAVTRSQSAE